MVSRGLGIFKSMNLRVLTLRLLRCFSHLPSANIDYFGPVEY